mgnify:CR=1 FL=1
MSWLGEFRRIYETYLGHPFNGDQWSVVQAAAGESLHVVAGPGTGKTSSMVSRILKLVFVDGIAPSEILATTFTKKAAEELRSRILSQGMDLKPLLLADSAVPTSAKTWINEVDMNQIPTGTLDSICQDILRESKLPGSSDPEPVDAFVASTIMFRDGLLFSGHVGDPDLADFLLPLHGPNPYGFNPKRKAQLIEEIYSRTQNDCVDYPAFEATGTVSKQRAKGIVGQVIDRYLAKLDDIGSIDFVQLEAEVLRRFRAGVLDDWRDRVKVLIVDEYQDTNLLQEQIYFEMARSCQVMTVVGDDDQSLYRFRGATVELFVDFPTRVHSALGCSVSQYFLRENYRSTQPIVDLVNSYSSLDADYQTVRVPPPSGGSRGIVCKSPIPNVFPVLGLFRPTLDELAEDLSKFIHDVFRGGGRNIPGAGNLVRDPATGDLGDCCLLAARHREFAATRSRLPRLLREKLESSNPTVDIFNPRGRPLADIEQVELLGGYVAHIADSTGTRLDDSGVGKYDEHTREVIERWMKRAADHSTDPSTPKDFKDYVEGWFDRRADGGKPWPRRVSILEFLNGLRHFMPFFTNDPEGVLYYEVFTRQFQACQSIGRWGADLVFDPAHPKWEERASFDLFDFFLGPIASGTVGVNEDLIESFPRNRLSVLSIHQAKGLEFPMVIADIGSDFTRNHHAQRRDRFPGDGESCHRLESAMRVHSTGITSPTRGETDRAFDDLYRKFFVGFSRPEQVLLLVGLDKSSPDGGAIQNVASGYDRNGDQRWPPGVPITFL